MATLSGRLAEKLAKCISRLPAAAEPQFVNGVWRSADISAKSLAKYRKLALIHGIEWPLPEKQHKPQRTVQKGHKHERNRAEREAKILKNLEDQPKFLENMRKEKEKRRTIRPKIGWDIFGLMRPSAGKKGAASGK